MPFGVVDVFGYHHHLLLLLLLLLLLHLIAGFIIGECAGSLHFNKYSLN
jgi:hypothetical protein